MPPTQPKTGWEIALQSHLASATADHRQTLSTATTPEDIVAILKRAQEKSKASKVNKLLDAVTRATAPQRFPDVSRATGTVAALSDREMRSRRPWQPCYSCTSKMSSTSQLNCEIPASFSDKTFTYDRWDMSRPKDEPLQLLWLRGTLGSGKTFLALYVSQTLLTTNHNVFRYYFSAKQEMGIRRSHISFVRTILYQAIVNTSLDTSSTLEALHYLREISGKSEAHSPMKLWSEIFRLVQDNAQSPIYLIFDALDEANQDERNDILQSFEKLISLAPFVRIMITSRPEEDILAWFEQSSRSDSLAKAVSQIRIAHQATIRDIKTYIQSRTQRSPKLRHPSVVEDVKSVVLNRAEGMFLPNPQSARELCRDLLAWVTMSYVPLHVDTLLVALKSQARARTAFKHPPTAVDDNDELELLDPLNEIRSICFPLLEVTEGGVVQFVHCSVAAYILTTGKSTRDIQHSSLLLTLPQASLEIAMACVYSLQTGGNWQTADDATATLDPSSVFPEYSTKYWPEHMSDSSQDALLLLPSLLQTLDAEHPRFLTWIRRRSEIDYRFRKFLGVDEGRLPGPLEIAAYFGVTSWAVSLLNWRRDIAFSLIPPSLIAASRGPLNILRLLYQQIGAGESWDAHKNHLLHAAARTGHPSVVQFLMVEAGCDIDDVDSFGQSALCKPALADTRLWSARFSGTARTRFSFHAVRRVQRNTRRRPETFAV
ncbi:hypothetical protein QBC37DRAFT_399869 [Rhypophila decipiens]|uniref:NACHT domain-containing protein n=1 Tax=Rhypophila decipiens TaxID=261697 RepID=A0AAN6Y8Q6_9PEZI|nr:hypothetical protein QBC37DRAFT_399869 [Rhypophila decipiens]